MASFDFTKITDGNLDSIVSKGLTINPSKRVIIIGLGGTGNDTLKLIKKSIYERFDLSATNNKIPDNIQFLSLDTDNAALIGLPQGDCVQLSDPNIVTDLHNKETHLPDYFKSWVNPNLIATTNALGSTGAGATRQFGRYLLMKNYGSVYNALATKIGAIQHCGGTNIDIIILSGISGGTGSGTFIDTGYIVRKVCADLGLNKYVQTTAYLYMPDANLGNPQTPPALVKNIRANGYAALKDLDYFMSIDDKHKVSSNANASKEYRFVQRYGTNNMQDVIRSEMPPFDSVYLVSGQTDVLQIKANSYEYAQNITADNIFNFIAGAQAIEGHDVDPTTGNTIQSSDINGAAMCATTPGFILPQTNRRQIANYKYKIMGAGMATLPVNEINDYICTVFLKKVNILKEQTPNANDFESFYKSIRMGNMDNGIMQSIGEPKVNISGSDLKDNPANNELLRKTLKNYKTTASTNMEAYIKNALGVLENAIITEINKIFEDIERGPFFANKIMADGRIGIIQKLIELAAQFKKKAAAYSQEVLKLDGDAKAVWNDANEAIMHKSKKYQQYIDIMTEYAVAGVKQEICERLADGIHGGTELKNKKNLVDVIREKNKGIYDVYTQLLETLSEKYDPNKVIQTRGNNVFIWNIVDLKDIKSDLDGKLDDNMINMSLNNMLIDMVKNSEEWCKDSKTMHKLSRFLGDNFQMILAQSMDDFLKHISPADLENQIKKLDNNAKEHFPINTAAVQAAMTSIADIVTVPKNSPEIEQSVDRYLANNGKQIVPTRSNIREKISWMRVSIGVPLFWYAYLQNCEQDYIQAMNTPGIHLYENPDSGICGRDYPELLPSHLCAHGFVNEGEAIKNKANEEIFNSAVNEGLVGSDVNAVHIKVTQIDWVKPELEKIAQKYGIKLENVSASVIGQADILNCKTELEGIKMPDGTPYKNIYLPETAFDEAHPNDQMEYAREMFIRMPEAVSEVKAEIKKRRGINKLIEALENMAGSFANEKDEYMSFVYADIFGIVKRNGLKYTYGNDDARVELAMVNMQKPWRYEAFGVFGSDIADVEKANTDAKYNEAISSNEGLEALVGGLKKMLENVTAESANLRYLKADNENEAPIIEFYNKMKMFIADELNALGF